MRSLLTNAPPNFLSVNKYDDVIRNLMGRFKRTSLPSACNCIQINFRDVCSAIRERDNYTHPIHTYPAKLIRHIPYFFISNAIYSKKGDTILDPFCGSGTVLVEAKLNGRNSYGVDINPLSRLLTKVKMTPLDCLLLTKEKENLLNKIKYCKSKESPPNFHNCDFWFTKKVQRELSIIKMCIECVNDPDFRDFFYICFSSIIRKVSNADPHISPPVKSKEMRKLIANGRSINVLQYFKDEIDVNIVRLSKFTSDCDRYSFAKLIGDDARNIELRDESVDLVITSPPYINAQKYCRSLKLELYWLGLVNRKELLNLDKKLIGTERAYFKEYNSLHLVGIEQADDVIELIYNTDPKRAFIVYKYFADMKKSIHETYRVLKNESYCVLVIGNNTVRSVSVPCHQIFIEIAKKQGFNVNLVLVDEIKSRGLMTKRNKTANLINNEWILVFRK